MIWISNFKNIIKDCECFIKHSYLFTNNDGVNNYILLALDILSKKNIKIIFNENNIKKLTSSWKINCSNIPLISVNDNGQLNVLIKYSNSFVDYQDNFQIKSCFILVSTG